jgi:outer membrane lipoprotein-sorting protein
MRFVAVARSLVSQSARPFDPCRSLSRFLCIWTALFCAEVSVRAATNDLLGAWLAAQTNVHTWSADVTQTRFLKSLTQPLTATGHVWFAAPNRFHWQLGNPPTTIAVRQAEQMLVIYPRLKRVERYPLNGDIAGPWKDTFALLEAGFPRSEGELKDRFNVVSQRTTGSIHELVLQPKSPSARRLMPQIRISFGIEDFALRATELQFADGSTLRNEFVNPQLNHAIEPALFDPSLDRSYEIVDPLKR